LICGKILAEFRQRYSRIIMGKETGTVLRMIVKRGGPAVLAGLAASGGALATGAELATIEKVYFWVSGSAAFGPIAAEALREENQRAYPPMTWEIGF
jgi:hypothetical protein